MSASLFFNPDLVEQLAACGISARRTPSPGAAPRGFVLANAQRPRGRATTHVVAAHGNVTITARQLRLPAEPTASVSSASVGSEPRTALELVEECTRLQRDNQRLSNEVSQLRAEIARLTAGPTAQSETVLDDSARRFSLLELD